MRNNKENPFTSTMKSYGPNFIIGAGLVIVTLGLWSCLFGQRKPPDNKQPAPIVQEPVLEPDKPIVQVNPEFEVSTFEYDGKEYIVIDKNGYIAITVK